MKQHQKHPLGFETISAYMKMYAHVPENIEDYAYLSQYIQLLGISTAIEAHRRAMPHCMGTLYWQFNDCWPVISWSGVDYYGRKKALQFHMQELYNPLKISMIEHEGHLQVWGISDNEMDESYSLIVHQKNFKGKGKSRKFEVKLAAGSSALLTEIPVPSKQKKRSKLFFHALLLKNGEVIAGNTFYPVFLKEQKLPDPKISINAAQHNDQILLELRSPVLCRFVELSYFGEVDVFDANYFDLLPGKTTTIHVNTEMIEDFDFRNIRIRTLNELIR
jgi:beta-mannosidase